MQIRLKVEINIAEIEAFDTPVLIDYSVKNPWFDGATTIPTFSPEELIATKLRALLQRNKGRDLFDLDHALTVLPELNIERVISLFGIYLGLQDQAIGRAEAEKRMLAKFAQPDLLGDIRALLPPDQSEKLDAAAGRNAFLRVFKNVIEKIPGQRWARADEIADRLAIPELMSLEQ